MRKKIQTIAVQETSIVALWVEEANFVI